MSNIVQEKFDDISSNYDKQRKKLIPCFDDFYGIPISLIESTVENCNVLDIGGGTGLFSLFLLRKYPKATITLIDLSEKMLNIAKLRFKDNLNIKYIVGDYTTYNYDTEYDVIISALSIHHLFHEQKKDLYKKCFSILNPKGIFINADQVLGITPYLELRYKKLWSDYIENSGLSNEEVISAYERIKLDKEVKLDQQLKWMEEAGFSDVECIYKYYHFAVMFGRRIN